MAIKEYVVSVGEKDAERLKIQHETFAPGTEAFLRSRGMKTGDRVLVIGSGGGDESFMFSTLVGSTGKVLGIDISDQQVSIANTRAKEKKILNTEFKTLDANALNSLEGEFDFVYCRMLLIHLSNPQNVLEKMYSKVKDGGILACEEPEVSMCHTIPSSAAFNEHISLLCRLISKNGGDPDIGPKLYNMFRTISSNLVGISFSQPIVTDVKLKKAVPLSVQSCAPGYITNGLTTEKNVKKLIEEINAQVVEQENVLLIQCRMSQVWLRKNKVLK